MKKLYNSCPTVFAKSIPFADRFDNTAGDETSTLDLIEDKEHLSPVAMECV